MGLMGVVLSRWYVLVDRTLFLKLKALRAPGCRSGWVGFFTRGDWRQAWS